MHAHKGGDSIGTSKSSEVQSSDSVTRPTHSGDCMPLESVVCGVVRVLVFVADGVMYVCVLVGGEARQADARVLQPARPHYHRRRRQGRRQQVRET